MKKDLVATNSSTCGATASKCKMYDFITMIKQLSNTIM